jgi:hypothetical protein
MNIKHCPITDTNKVCELYSKKDGIPVKYVCTTEFNNAIADVFYRETPHPEFGNKYFSILFRDDKMYIANADQVEDCAFGMVENDEGNLEYSIYRHDYKSFKNGNMIDGGRDYIRSSGKVKVFVVRDGVMKHFGANDEGYI